MKAVLLNGITPAQEVALSEARIPEVRPGYRKAARPVFWCDKGTGTGGSRI